MSRRVVVVVVVLMMVAAMVAAMGVGDRRTKTSKGTIPPTAKRPSRVRYTLPSRHLAAARTKI
jgi:hypothetical protein